MPPFMNTVQDPAKNFAKELSQDEATGHHTGTHNQCTNDQDASIVQGNIKNTINSNEFLIKISAQIII